MARITVKELEDKYPMMYRAFKCAAEFQKSPQILLPEFEFIDRTCQEDPSREKEMVLRMAIYHGVMKTMVEMVKNSLQIYEKQIKNYEKLAKVKL